LFREYSHNTTLQMISWHLRYKDFKKAR
jgi:hypothetical protein